MSSPSFRALGAALLFAAASAAHAQYVWIGPDGTRQYSDRPPPPGTPAAKIVKAPGRSSLSAPPPPAPAPAPEPVAAPDATAKPTVKKGPPTVAEQELAYRERIKAREEQERKGEQEAQRQRALAERCKAARETQAQLASGARIARYSQDGQKSYMTDADRAAQNAQVNQALQDCR